MDFSVEIEKQVGLSCAKLRATSCLIRCNVHHFQPIEKNIVIYINLAYFNPNIYLLFLMDWNLIKDLKIPVELDHSYHQL